MIPEFLNITFGERKEKRLVKEGICKRKEGSEEKWNERSLEIDR